jgi:hypothetical protein
MFTDQRQPLAARGFFIADHFLEPKTIRDLIDSVESLEPDANATRIRSGIPFARRNLIEFDFVRNIVERPAVRDLLDSIAPSLIPVRAILFDKISSANWTVPWHQDRSIAVRERIDAPGFGPWSIKAGIVHVQPPVAILQQLLTLRFHLDPCPAANGPLRVIPGTHHRILDQIEVEHAITHCNQSLCTTDAGGLLAMRPLLLHASSPAITPSHRRVIHIEFGPVKLPGHLTWAIPEIA